MRKPWVLSVSLSPEEQQLYQNLSDRIRTVARRQNPGTPGEFVLIGRQRQLASCIPAALTAWRESGHLDELLWEALGVELGQPDGGFPDVPLDDLMSGYDFELRTKSHGRFGGERQLELPIPIPESANMGQVAPATNGPLVTEKRPPTEAAYSSSLSHKMAPVFGFT